MPLTGVFPLAPSRDTVGPIATTVEDAALAYAAMAGDDPDDPWSRPAPVRLANGPTPLAGVRFGIPHPWVDRPLATAIAAAWVRVRRALTATGAIVVDLDAPGLDPSSMPRAVYAEVGTVHREWYQSDPARYGPAIRDRLALDMNHSADAVVAAVAWRQRLIGAFERQTNEVEILLTPTTPTRHKEIGVDLVEAGAAPEPHRQALAWFTNLVNQAGLPALAVPLAGTAGDGPPVSIQLIGPAWEEHRILEIGWGMEEAGLVGYQRPPR